MARPKKRTVDYFPHIIKNGKTITILENKFGNDGYAFWFKLLEILGSTDGHYYEYRNITDKEFLHAKTLVCEDIAKKILNLLAELDAIDKELWEHNIIWSGNFIDNIEDAYARRRVNVPQKPTMSEVNVNNNSSQESNCNQNDNKNSQSKVNKSKVNNSKVNNSKEISAHIDEIKEVYDCWINNLKDINEAKLTKKQKEVILTKLKKWSAERLKRAIRNYNEVYRSDYYYSHNFTMFKFIKQGNGAPRFIPGLDSKYDGDLWKDYL